MIEGLYTVLVTPFDEKEALDEEGLQFLIQRQLKSGVDGLTILGSTGETPTLDDDEQESIIKLAIAEVDKKIPVMVGCGSNSTKIAIKKAEKAAKLGASSLLVVTPYYNRPTQQGIYLHFKEVAKAVDIPICIYNVQSRTGQNIEVDTICRLSEIPNIVAIKESSGNIAQIGDIIERVRISNPRFSVLSGDDFITLPLIALGGNGLLSVIGNLVPRLMKRLVDKAKSDIEEAREIHHSLKPLMRAAFIETNPMPIKRLLELSGLPAGPCRLPLCRVLPENDLKLKLFLEQHSDLLSEELIEIKV